MAFQAARRGVDCITLMGVAPSRIDVGQEWANARMF